jgi:hypothetical protein
VVVSDFRSLRGDIVFRPLFSAPVSGGKNLVPNAERAGRGKTDAIEAQAFVFFGGTGRFKGLPLSYPATMGAPIPMTVG